MRDEIKFSKFVTQVHRFFEARGFLHTYTNPMVENPGMETHIHPFEVHSAHGQKKTDWYLHTSPEFAMKKLLSEGIDKIYQICWCFRDEPNSDLHRPQFLMLEWYRRHARYEDIMKDLEDLITDLSPESIVVQKKTVSDIFQEFVGFDILDYLDNDQLHQQIKKELPHLPLFEKLKEWDDYFFLIFLNEIEPKLAKYPALILFEYPFHQAALSTIKKNDPRVCERFELYLSGVEIANCFNESTDKAELKMRFANQIKAKQDYYQYNLPEPKEFFHTMEDYPKSAGIALGLERLYAALNNDQPFR